MGIWHWLLDHLNKPRTNVVASILEFPSIDIQGMVGKLRLKQHAKEKGEQQLPLANSTDFDATEYSIINEIETEGKTQFTKYLDHQQTYAERASDAGVKALLLRISAAVSSATASFERNTHSGTGHLYACKREVIESGLDLQEFKNLNGLTSPPRDYGPKTYKIGILILILAIESLLNGFFLSKGSEFGMIGGISQALIIACINVFAGAAVGRLVLPWLFHRDRKFKALAGIGMLMYFLLNAGFNLAVAHYRNAVASNPFEASSVAYHSLLQNPLGINDIQSWLLFLVGFLVSCVAIYDGLRMDDPYPGYGQRMRQNLEALDEYNDLKNQLLSELDEIRKEAEDHINETSRDIETRQREIDYMVLKSQALKTSMVQHFDHLERAGNTLLGYYREENQRHRGTPAPPRFNVPWKYSPPSFGDEVLSPENPETFRDLVTRVLEDIPQQRQLLYGKFREACDQYRRIDDLVRVEREA